MAAVNGEIVAEPHDPSLDRVDQLFVIAARQIRPPDRAAKKTIAGKNSPLVLFSKYDMSQGMAGNVPNCKFQIAYLVNITIL